LFAGENRPSFAESYDRLTANCPSEAPKVEITDDDDAAIYFSSGTTGFPKAILHAHRSLVSACYTEQKHHGQTRRIIFVYSAPLSYRCENALVRKFAVRQQSSIAKGY